MPLFWRLHFFITKRWFPEYNLKEDPISAADLVSTVNRCSIAIVGNARSLSQSQYGPNIDAADIVIRINRAPMPSEVSHGSKTDWLALATSLSRSEFERIGPNRLLWMSPKRKRLRSWMIETNGFYLQARTLIADLTKILAAPPTTGLMVIDLIRQSRAQSVELYGFDFFKSNSLTGSRNATQVPHDFAAEKKWVEDLLDSDTRFSIHL